MVSDFPNTVTKLIHNYILAALPDPRYKHSVRVAELAASLCTRFGVDPDLGYLAGLAHDMCKVGRDRWLLSLAERDGLPICQLERDKPALLHGRAAAMLLLGDFGVDNPSVLDAIRHHTFGSPGMDALGKIIFVSDKIEPGRGMESETRKRVLESSLDEMTLYVLRDNVRFLESKNREVSPLTRSMLESLQKEATV